jgi:signal transduction histidine kinase
VSRSRQPWAEVVHALPLAIVVLDATDLDGPSPLEVLVANPAAEELLGPGTLLREHLVGLVSAQDDPRGRSLRDALRTRAPTELGEFEVPSERDARSFRLHLLPLPEGCAGVALEEVTARRRALRDRQELLQRSVDVASAERERLADELHDDVVQLLTAALLRVDLAALASPDDTFAAIREPLDEAVRSLRRTMLELAPAEPSVGGLTAAIDAYAERLLKDEGIEVELAVDLGESPPIPGPTLLTANRIIQEALSIVHRHAGASRVAVRLERVGPELVGQVTDDGRGIEDADLHEPRLGVGLMIDRAELVGGWLRVEPRGSAVGTVVTFSLPTGGS